MRHDKVNVWRTYISCVRIGNLTYWYAGQHKFSEKEIKYGTNYFGSGTEIQKMVSIYGLECVQTKWLSWFNNLKDVNAAELNLIRKLQNKHGPLCLNMILVGSNDSPCSEMYSKIQKVVQNRPERKLRQSEIMDEFYTTGGAEKVSIGLKRKQRTGEWWKLPLKKKIFEIWDSLESKSNKNVLQILNKTHPNITGSQIKNLLYEFRDCGYIEPEEIMAGPDFEY